MGAIIEFIVSIAFLRLKNTIATKNLFGCLEETSPYLRKPFPRKIIYLNPLTHMCAGHLLAQEDGGATARAVELMTEAKSDSARMAKATDRELMYVEAIDEWCQGGLANCVILHQQILDKYPKDMWALKRGVTHCLNNGDWTAHLAMVESVLPYNKETPFVMGMYAFALGGFGKEEEAEKAAMAAVQNAPEDVWAQRSLAHYYYNQGLLKECTNVCEAYCHTWSKFRSFLLTHNMWHTALILCGGTQRSATWTWTSFHTCSSSSNAAGSGQSTSMHQESS